MADPNSDTGPAPPSPEPELTLPKVAAFYRQTIAQVHSDLEQPVPAGTSLLCWSLLILLESVLV